MTMLSSDAIRFIPASRFTVEELTAIYNRTRVDYMIPMPMDPARLEQYIESYDVDLDRSFVASEDGEPCGIAMLGVRAGRTWITRLGVVPSTRRSGMGEALSRRLLDESKALGVDFTMMEVIKDNIPAYRLFRKLGFYEVRELLILKRTPSQSRVAPVPADVRWLDRNESLDLIDSVRGIQPWTNQPESMRHARDVSGLSLTLPDRSRGWLVHRREDFTLTHFIYGTEEGNPEVVAHALLSNLHREYPQFDVHIENIQVNDPHLPSFYRMGYAESFRRIEMWRGDPPRL